MDDRHDIAITATGQGGAQASIALRRRTLEDGAATGSGERLGTGATIPAAGLADASAAPRTTEAA